MIATQTLPRLSVADYLAYARESDRRHELVDGYLYAMTGAAIVTKRSLLTSWRRSIDTFGPAAAVLQEYVMVTEDSPPIEVLSRTQGGWDTLVRIAGCIADLVFDRAQSAADRDLRLSDSFIPFLQLPGLRLDCREASRRRLSSGGGQARS